MSKTISRIIFYTIVSLLSFIITPSFVFAEDTVSMHLRIETYDQTLFSGPVNVSPCLDTETGTTTSINAYCALSQVASSSGWTLGATWYPFGLSLDAINAYSADFANNRFWIYYSDRNPGLTSLHAHHLKDGEELLLTFGIHPLRIVPSTTTPALHASSTLQAQFFDPILFDWVNASTSVFTIDGNVHISNDEGVVSIIPSSTTTIVASVEKLGYVTSNPIVLFPHVSEISTSSASTTEAQVVPSSPSSQVGSPTTDNPHTIDTWRAIRFLEKHQQADGSFGSPMYTDWVAIAIAQAPNAEVLRAGVQEYTTTHLDAGSSLTDNLRRVMALEALGIDPARATAKNYIHNILTQFDGRQFGNPSLINDDIFSILSLTHAGYGIGDPVIASSVAHVLATQSPQGRWESVDLTAATIVALAPFRQDAVINDAIHRAVGYLREAQLDNGGFGSSFATSWVLNAIYAIGDPLSLWTKNSRTPSDALWVLQASDGGIEPENTDIESRIWATAYALTPSLKKSWNDILGSYPKWVQENSSSISTGGEVLGATTSTQEISTSTVILGDLGTSSEMTLQITASSSIVVATSSLFMLSTTTPSVHNAMPSSIASIVMRNSVSQANVKQTASSQIIKTGVATSAPMVVIPESQPQVKGATIAQRLWMPFARLFTAVRSWFD